jgi:hypothetical protein
VNDRTPLRISATAAALAFLLLGCLGFIPHSGDELFGLFQVTVLLNVVHLSFGAAGLALAPSDDGARRFLQGGGAASLVLWLAGVSGGADWVPVNTADNWLHLLLGIGMLGLSSAATSAWRPSLRAQR